MAKHAVRQRIVPHTVTRNAKLQGAQRTPELTVRSTVFRSAENLTIPTLYDKCMHGCFCFA